MKPFQCFQRIPRQLYQKKKKKEGGIYQNVKRYPLGNWPSWLFSFLQFLVLIYLHIIRWTCISLEKSLLGNFKSCNISCSVMSQHSTHRQGNLGEENLPFQMWKNRLGSYLGRYFQHHRLHRCCRTCLHLQLPPHCRHRNYLRNWAWASAVSSALPLYLYLKEEKPEEKRFIQLHY